MNSQTPRRSTRISQAGSAISARTTGTAATAATTRSRRARASGNNLPVLQTTTSSAYGAAGNPLIGGEQSTTGNLEIFFDRKRNEAQQRDQVTAGSKRPPPPPSPTKDPTPPPPPADSSDAEGSRDSEDSDEADDHEEPVYQPSRKTPRRQPPRVREQTTMPPPSTRKSTSAIRKGPAAAAGAQIPSLRNNDSFHDTTLKSFSGDHETGAIGAHQIRKTTTTIHTRLENERVPTTLPTVPSQPRALRGHVTTPEEPTTEGPATNFQDWVAGQYREVTRSFSCWSLFPILASVLVCLYLVFGNTPQVPTFRWNPFPSRYQPISGEDSPAWFYDSLTPRIESLERRVDVHDGLFRQFQSDLDTLRDGLPEFIAVQRAPDGQSWDLAPEFWNALQNRLAGSLGSTMTTAWENWIAKNERIVENLTQKDFDESLDAKVGAALKNRQIISRQTVLEILEDKYAGMNTAIADSVMGDIRKELQRVNRDSKSVAVSAVHDQFKQLPLRQLEALAQANLVRNSELSLKRVNFFSPAYSSYILPRLTSQTHMKSVGRWFARAYLSVVWIPGQRAPAEALSHWREPDDCWCAASSPDLGKAQLGIDMKYRVFPTSLTIEHYPKQGVINVSSAPKELEFWASISDPDQRKVVREAREAIFGGSVSDCSEPGKGLTDFVCLGKFTYDIDAPNHVQNFDMELSLKDLGVAVNRVAARVVSNYGKEWTCLYRLMLHGELEDPRNAM